MRNRPGGRHKKTSRPGRARLRYGAVALVCAGAACLAGPAGRALGIEDDDDRDATSPFWAEPASPAARQVKVWEERGREDDAEALRRISERPTAVWLTGDDPMDQAEEVTRRAERSGRIPVLVAYNIPHRDCGQYSSGGAADAEHYRAWTSRAAAGIGSRQAWVILEPDALAQWASGCVPEAAAKERLGLLAEAVKTFKAQPGTSVYLDAGNPGWIADQHHLASALRKAGIADADGFSLNVSNFHTTPVTRTYGDRLSSLLGGTHYIVDTSRNGNGPLPANSDSGPKPTVPGRPADEKNRSGTEADKGPEPGAESWCNPPGRALGAPPTTATGDPLIDAFLWIKRPGESDGACRGAPPAGRWWAPYALELAQAAEAAATRPAGKG
jgi:endoglucanase